MKIIAQGKSEKKENQNAKGGTKMKKVMIIAVLISTVLVMSNNAFAYWKAPVGIEIYEPTIIPAVEAEINLR